MFGKKKDNPGYYKGRHYTEYVETVKQLKREDKLDEAETLLLALIDAVEAENKINQWGAAPWYYEQLAIIYRKNKEYAAELGILERFKLQPYNKQSDMFKERIAKARELQAKAKATS